MVYADWTMELMNGQNDRKEIKLELPLKQIWMKKYSQISCPVLMEDKLYVLDDESKYFIWGNRRLIVWEIDKKTGEKTRKHVIGEVPDIKYRRMIGYDGKIFVSVIWRDEKEWKNEKLYSYLFAYDIKNKKTIWNHTIGPIIEYGMDRENIGSWLNADDKKIFLVLMQVRKNNKLFCFDANNGNILWKTNRPENVKIDNTYPAIGNGKVYLGTTANQEGGKITAFDINTGSVVWEKAFSLENENMEAVDYSNMIFQEDVLYVPFQYKINKGILMALNASDGNKKWLFQDNDKEDSFFNYTPLIDQKAIYACEFDDFLYKIDKKTGKLIWRFTFTTGGSHPLRFQTTKYIAYTTLGQEGYAQLIFIDKQTGQEAARYDLPSEINRPGLRHITDVVADNNQLFAILEDGRFYALANMGK